jgi:hypothetical protein
MTQRIQAMLWVALVVAIVIAIYELPWNFPSDTSWVLFELAVAIVSVGVHLVKEREMKHTANQRYCMLLAADL